jgi:hypothetical protein
VSFTKNAGSWALRKGAHEGEEDGDMEELNGFDVQSLAGRAKELVGQLLVQADQTRIEVSPCVCVVLRPKDLRIEGSSILQSR